MKRLALILLASTALAACESFPTAVGPDITLDEPDYVEDLYLAPDVEETVTADADLSSTPVVYRTYTPTTVTGAMPGQLKPMPAEADAPSLKPYQAIETANGKAAVEPSLDNPALECRVQRLAERAAEWELAIKSPGRGHPLNDLDHRR